MNTHFSKMTPYISIVPSRHGNSPSQQEYRINENPETYVDIVVKKVSEIMGISPFSEIIENFRLSADDTILHINEFYPYGKGLKDNDPQMKKGVGVKVLEKIISDAKNKGMKGIYVFTTGRPGMLAFLEKHNFVPIKPGMFYYKDIRDPEEAQTPSPDGGGNFGVSLEIKSH